MNLLSRSQSWVAVVAGAVALAGCSSSSSSSPVETTSAKVESARADALERLDKSSQVVAQLGEKIPQPVASRARCVVVVPSLVKAGLIVGGQGGKGYATCRTNTGWSAPAPISIGGGTLGAQIGGESTELLAIVQSEKGMRALASGSFKVGVNASASAGPVGTGRGTSTDASVGGDLVSYSRSKGLFAGANLDGTSLKGDNDATRALYGASHELSTLLDGRVPAPNDPASQRFLGAVQRGGFGTAGGPVLSSL